MNRYSSALILILISASLTSCNSKSKETSETQTKPHMHGTGSIAPSAPSAENPNTPDDHVAFNLSPQKQEMIGVKTGTVEKKELFKQIRASGRLAFDPDLYTAENEYVEALKQTAHVKNTSLSDVKHSSERMVQSAKLRLKILGLSDQQITALGNRESTDANLLINKPGSQVWVYADIYELDLDFIKPGIAAEVTAEFLGGQTLSGKVVSVDRVITPASRTAKARILVQQAKTLLRPEAYVDVTILAPLGEQVTVPFNAIFDTGKQAWVFVLTPQGDIAPRRVTIKFRSGDDVAILQGLEGGETIVTSANFLIDSESRLRAVTGSQAKGDSKTAAPSCPKGKQWNTQMGMCMND